jgi:hypothetical protein
MMKSCGIGWGALLMLLALPVFVLTSSFGSEQVDKLPPVITITMKDCPVSESSKKTTEPSLVQLAAILSFGKGAMAKQGQLSVAGRDYAVYLPKAKSYSRMNTAATELRLLNTSSVIYIDQNGDGRLTPDEAWNANRPIRVADEMFDVVDLAADGSKSLSHKG